MAKMVFAHWFTVFPRSIDNGATDTTDYYGAQFLNPNGEGGIHITTGGYMRDRPTFRAPAGGSWGFTDAQWEIAKAIEAGIDGFTVNTIGTSGAYWNRFVNMLAAAETFPNFKIIPMPDAFASGAVTYQQWADALNPYLGSTALYKDGGIPVIAPWAPDTQGSAYWQDFVSYLQTTHGRTVKFMPCFLSAQFNNFAPFSYAMSYWGGRSTAQNSTAAGLQVKALNKQLMMPVAAQDYRAHKYGLVYWEASNSGLWRQMWDHAVSTDAEMVQIATWNDYSEHTHVAPSKNNDEVFIWLTKYYATKFKTGSYPAITEDRLILSHRKHATSVSPSSQTQTSGLSSGSTAAQNSVEVMAFLTAAKTLTINVGGTIYTESAPAGFSVWTKPLAAGTISASIPGLTVTSPTTVVTSTAYQDLQYKYTMAAGESEPEEPPPPGDGLLLTDFTFLARPGISDNDQANATPMNIRMNFSGENATLGGYMSFPRPADLGPALGNQYTVMVMLDPNQSNIGVWRTLFAVPPYTGSTHVAPYADLSMAISPNSSQLSLVHSISSTTNVLAASGVGFIDTVNDGMTCYIARRNGDTVEFLKNGILHSTATGAGTTPPQFNSNSNVTIASRSQTSPGEGLIGLYRLVAIYPGLLTNEQLVTISANPLGFEDIPSGGGSEPSVPGDPINNASMIYLGTTPVDKVMCGTTQIWLL